MLDIELILHAAGITSNYKGYWLLDSAVEMVMADTALLSNLVDGVYKVVGEKFGISQVSVERNIHTAITRAWEVAPQRVNKALNRSRLWRPTASEFITLVLKQLDNQ
ncbi:MAG: hypothetical protein IKJ05_02000 [Oscillospiraceae bacterium]|nr:hypothetical protein [Oscillospiraceae bacterium]